MRVYLHAASSHRRTNANAERVADAIIIACMAHGAPKPEGKTYTAEERASLKKGSK